MSQTLIPRRGPKIPRAESTNLQIAELVQGVRRRKGHMRGVEAAGQQPALALCAISVLLAEWAREVAPANRTNANFSDSQRFIATEALWYAMREDPDAASAFIVGGRPTWPGAGSKVDISRIFALRLAGGVPLTKWAWSGPAPLA